jgi:DNA-binding transcriptional regulator YiaG
MSSSLKERLERLGPVRDVSRVASGSPAVMFLRPAKGHELKSVTAALTLANRGVPLLKAKRAVEEMARNGVAVLELPKVEDRRAVLAEFAAAGIHANPRAEGVVNVKALRERLGLTQEQFSLRFGIDIDTLQNWERRRRVPDLAAQRFLRVIERAPEAAARAQEEIDIRDEVRENAPAH